MTAQIIPFRKAIRPRVRRSPYKKPSSKLQKQLNDFCRALGERLRFARTQLGISEEDAACAFGVRVRTYRRYEAVKPVSWIRGPIFYCTANDGLFNFSDTFGMSLNWPAGFEGTKAEAPRFRLRAV